jgi:MFS family permease
MIVGWVKSTYVEPSLRLLRLRAATCYLEGVKGARRILILVCLLVFVITLVCAGFVLVPVSMLLFMPWDPDTKAVVGIAVGAVYVLVPAIASIFLLSEKRWMRITGATEVLSKLVD